MKKGLILLFIFISLLTAACSFGQNSAANSSANTAVAGQANPSITGKIPDNANYEIIRQTYTNKNSTISYPQVADLNDAKKQETINEIIKTEALGIPGRDDPDVYITIDYQIKCQTAEVLSIAYSGLFTAIRAAHPTLYFYTTNIDMQNGTKIRLKDIVNIDSNFVAKVEKGKIIEADPEVTPQMLMQALQFEYSDRAFTIEDDFRQGNDFLNRAEIYSYFTKDSLGISVKVLHAIHDHFEFEVKYQDIVDNIKTNNAVWKGFYNFSPGQ